MEFLSDFDRFEDDEHEPQVSEAQPWERWEDADTMGLDESGYFREAGRRLAARR